ncbi:hypothetical protein Q2T40_11435 [Winogradskyella maritima]|uniref:Uncharacterized protein n=1 Tax=Winogradskyella maritima TaxID=1517766 RepID=A0ABV8AHT9_9FLAO|nr:hypothetical protein [Winogradskyella maritima]
MYPILRKILAIVIGWLAGSAVNMGLVQLGHTMYPVEGLDPNDLEAMAEIMPTLSSEHFIFPFLAHAMGTLVGATIAGLIAQQNKMRFAMIVGVLFLLGGIMINYMIPGPTWFTIADLLIAYIPMAYLGGTIAKKLSKKSV